MQKRSLECTRIVFFSCLPKLRFYQLEVLFAILYEHTNDFFLYQKGIPMNEWRYDKHIFPPKRRQLWLLIVRVTFPIKIHSSTSVYCWLVNPFGVRLKYIEHMIHWNKIQFCFQSLMNDYNLCVYN